jgi:hypothetical protein
MGSKGRYLKKTSRAPYLGLELTMHVLKSQIHLARQSLFKWNQNVYNK